ncbi:transposase family protein [Streptomyces sp. AC512_CC834]|uniref:transposase family protein n=1 Tax=Streptomyces sp. AC512_CC834 TaxID=2823691 RepID=UPI0035AE072F
MPSSRISAPVRTPVPDHELLFDLLGRMPDPRRLRGVRHPAGALIAVAVCAVMAGARGFTAIGEWVRDAGAVAMTRLGLERGSDRHPVVACGPRTRPPGSSPASVHAARATPWTPPLPQLQPPGELRCAPVPGRQPPAPTAVAAHPDAATATRTPLPDSPRSPPSPLHPTGQQPTQTEELFSVSSLPRRPPG